MQLKKNIFLCIYKMYLISTEGYKNVKAIKTTSETSVNMKDIGSGNKNKLPIDVTYKNKMKTYCVKCKKDTESIDRKMVTTKNNRLIMQLKCSVCGTKK